MKTIKIIIEKSSDSYGAYAENVNGIYGAGDSAEECRQSILDAIETIKTLEDEQIPAELKGDYKITYKFDSESFLSYYKGIFTNAALEKMTGINSKQIQHYASGHRKPKEVTIKKFESALHSLGKELLAVEL